MSKNIRYTLLSLRDLAVSIGPFALLTLALLALTYWWLDPNPPKRVVLATGPAQSAYDEFGKRYADALARYNIAVELLPSEGSAANLQLLRDGQADLAFVQGGSVAPAFPLAEQLARVPEVVRMQAWAQARDGAPLLWVRYVPSEECFYQGDDPLHQANQTPGWLWTGMSARAAWPALAELDAYRCMLDFDVLVAADRGEVDAHYRYVPDQVHIVEVPALCLLIPQGDSNGGPVYEDFVEDALALIDHQDLTGFKRAVDTMIQLSSSSLWLSSALRWMQLLLTAAQPDTAALRRLVSAVNTFEKRMLLNVFFSSYGKMEP